MTKYLVTAIFRDSNYQKARCQASNGEIRRAGPRFFDCYLDRKMITDLIKRTTTRPNKKRMTAPRDDPYLAFVQRSDFVMSVLKVFLPGGCSGRIPRLFD